jgi:hypothetical protein
MKLLSLLFIFIFILAGCQVSKTEDAGGLISGNAPAENKFTLSTTLNKTYLVGETISLSLTFPNVVTVTGGTPSVNLTIGASNKVVPLSSGNNTSTLVFSYTVLLGDDDLNGIQVATTLDKNGASIKYNATSETSTIITVPNLTSVLVNTSSGTAPVANNITPAAFNEDIQSVITLSYTDADADLATSCALSSLVKVTVTQVCACAAGTCTVGVTGTANSNGAASFQYTVTANSQVSNLANATLSITPVDDAPIANNITPASFNENTQSIITLSYVDVDLDQASVCSISGATNVTVTQACACASGTCTVGVTGTLNYFGAASFNYTVTANAVVSNSATASLTILNVDAAPVANNITPAAFNEDVQSIITLSYTDADSDLATVCATSGLTNVTVTQACACAAGTCTVGVTGTLNHNGAASFNYTVTANSAVSNSASATLSINPVDDAPVAINITPASFNENTQSIITLSYTDAEGDLATACSIASPTNVTVTQACSCTVGTCTVGVTGTLNYSGTASFDYTVTANAVVSNTATATLTIDHVDNAPVANNITPAAFNEDVQSVITLSYTDADSDLATVCALSGLTSVTVTQACACAAGTCTVGVTGTSNYNGAASFNYTVTANSAVSNSASATLTINPMDDAPVANNITPAAFNEDIQSVITLSYTDTESDLATVCALSGLTNVTITQACACAAGTCTVGVTGTSNYNGAASFNYTVTANSAVSNSASATLTINPVDDAPVANNITPPNFNKNAQSIITLSYTDVDSDQASVCSISGQSNVTVTQACACAAGTCTVGVTGTFNYFGAASFNFTVTANAVVSNSASATLTIVNVDNAPVANNITPAAFNEDVQSIITLSYTDSDSDLATACAASALSNVTVTQACACVAGTCTVGVAGTNNYNGAASFSYTVTANSVVSNLASATLTINPVDDAPVAINITPAAFNEDTQGIITLTYTDPEGDFATACSISGPTNVTVTQACSCTVGTCTVGVTGTLNYNGTASFGYTVTANALVSNTATASLTISPVEDAAVANNITPAAFNEDVQSIITLSYTDVDSQATSCAITPTNVTVTQACACAAGTCTVGVTGTLNYNGAAGFTYTVTANSVASNVATATLTINPVNDNPTISAIGVQTGSKNTPTGSIAFTINDVDNTLTCTAARLSMTSSNTAVVASGSVAWSGTAPNCTAIITPVANQVGTTSITFALNDGSGGTANSVFTLNINGVILIWTDNAGATISAYSFGTPGANTTATVKIKNIGNITSSSVVVTDDNGSAKISQSNSCITIDAGVSCPVTLGWVEKGSGGLRTEVYTVTADGSAPTLTVTGTH